MSKSLVLAGVITALVAGSAVASDLPNKKGSARTRCGSVSF